MNLKSIINQIDSLVKTARVPQSTFPTILVACSAINKSGLSAMQLTSQIITDLQKNGFNMGNLADGSQNGWATSIAIGIKDIIEHFKKHGRNQSTTAIGGVTVQVGDMECTNTKPVPQVGIPE